VTRNDSLLDAVHVADEGVWRWASRLEGQVFSRQSATGQSLHNKIWVGSVISLCWVMPHGAWCDFNRQCCSLCYYTLCVVPSLSRL